MSTTPAGWFSQQLGDFAGELFGGAYLRDYTHASKIFRTNGYQNTPKYKYLFHTSPKGKNGLHRTRQNRARTIPQRQRQHTT